MSEYSENSSSQLPKALVDISIASNRKDVRFIMSEEKQQIFTFEKLDFV